MKFNALALLFALTICTCVVAEDDTAKKKRKNTGGRNNVATNLLKQLKDVGLTEEQTSKIQELGKKTMVDIKAAQAEAGITPELMKKRTAAQKEMKDSGKKQQEIAKAVNEKLELSDAQVAGLKKANELRSAMMKSVVAMLTDDQKAKLPERLARMNKAKKGKGKGKGKGKQKEEA